MIDESNTETLIKEIDRLFKEINNGLKMIGKRGNNMIPDDIEALLIKEPFVLSPPLKEHFEIEEIEDPV